MKNISPETLAWVAGFFDGEGCISIWKQVPSKYREKARSTSFILKVSVCNTDESSIDFLVSLFGGTKSKAKAKPQKNQKEVFRWEACAQKAEDVLRKIYPYLRIKKFRASIAFEFRESIKKTSHLKYVRTSLEDINIREALRDRLMTENKRGIL